jgi:thiamine biosynthesis lipoprotein
MSERVSRRRVLTMIGMTAAGLATGSGRGLAAAIDYEWRGTAMGADARLLFCGGDRAAVRAAVRMAMSEIDRLEDALSLFRDRSEIARLNRDGRLVGPSGDLRRALALGLTVARSTGGLYDPTVQALWEAHVDWFAARPAAELPPDALIAQARARVGWRSIDVAAGRIELGERRRITLNGLGQGYVTDRVADLLRQRGFEHVLVDLGEQRALGSQADGAPWLIARVAGAPIALSAGALATSEGAGYVIGAGGLAHHLFDLRTGRSAQPWRRLTVAHRSAAVATPCRPDYMPHRTRRSATCWRAFRARKPGRPTVTGGSGVSARRTRREGAGRRRQRREAAVEQVGDGGRKVEGERVTTAGLGHFPPGLREDAGELVLLGLGHEAAQAIG